jgi:hypothetical protein
LRFVPEHGHLLLVRDQPAKPDALCSTHGPLHVPRWRFLRRADAAGKARGDWVVLNLDGKRAAGNRFNVPQICGTPDLGMARHGSDRANVVALSIKLGLNVNVGAFSQ